MRLFVIQGISERCFLKVSEPSNKDACSWFPLCGVAGRLEREEAKEDAWDRVQEIVVGCWEG